MKLYNVANVSRSSAYGIISQPVISEKSYAVAELNKYIFLVDPRANKKQIAQSVETVFDVQVKSVNIVNQKGKSKTFKGVKGKRADVKKAYVTLSKGSIDLFGGAS